jgi:hypothetical protein
MDDAPRLGNDLMAQPQAALSGPKVWLCRPFLAYHSVAFIPCQEPFK